MKTEPQKEHRWLEKLVGEWTYDIEAIMGPDKPPEKSKGSETVRSLGGLWTVGEGASETPGCGPAQTMMTLGYDPRTKRFVGTWIGSMMDYLWHYDGELDAAGKVLTLNAEGPAMSGDGKMAKYQDIIEFLSDDHRTLKSRFLKDDGTWNEFMTAHYRRAIGD